MLAWLQNRAQGTMWAESEWNRSRKTTKNLKSLSSNGLCTGTVWRAPLTCLVGDFLRAWGRVQGTNGMIPEQLMCGCTGGIDGDFDHGCGRKMSDVSSMYIIYLLELLKWANDTALVKELWPSAKRAAEWLRNMAAQMEGDTTAQRGDLFSSLLTQALAALRQESSSFPQLHMTTAHSMRVQTLPEAPPHRLPT